jgi:transposase
MRSDWATLGSSAAEIARILGWSIPTVHVFDLAPKGGRRNQYLTVEEEIEFLSPFLAKAKAGGILNATEVKVAFEALVGRSVAKSTIYRMLERQDWRKIAPRPRHPKADLAAQAAFKKTQKQSR